MNRRAILSSFALIAAVVAVYIGGTGAFFSDTFASEENVFTTEGVTIDVTAIGHTYLGTPGVGEDADPTGFTTDGLTFSFTDLKPLDTGTLDFDIENVDNEAFVCAYIGGEAPGDAAGLALYDNLQFYNGANQLTFNEWIDLGVVGGDGGTTDVQVDYCFGDPVVNSGGIVSCNHGTIDFNPAQNGTFSADFYLFAIQTRNNEGFTCDALEFDPNAVNPEDRVIVKYDYLAEVPVKVGAKVVAYTPPVDPGATCDLTVDANASSPVAPVYNTLTAAEAAAAPNQTICVDSGTYVENVTVDVAGVTILGLNDPKAVGKATVDGRVDVVVDGVTISGLEFTNPDAGYAVVINDVSDTEIAFNSFVDIATTLTLGSAQAVYYVGGATAENGLVIRDNAFNNIGNPGMKKPASGSSAKAIFIGDSTAPAALTSVSIINNTISNVFASSDTFANGGRGAYGILINFGAGVTSPVIKNNTIETIGGWWAHAVGLETSTPGAEVIYNAISNVTGASSGDSQGVFLEANPNSDVQINFNNFAPGVAYGVGIHSSNPAITVDAQFNWWGDADPSDDIDQQSGTIDYTPFELEAYTLN